MPEDKSKWGLFNSKGELIFSGSYEACKAQRQRRHEDNRRAIADQNAERQRRWEQQGGRDDLRDRS